MKRIFTDYVRSFDGEGTEPDAIQFEELWGALRSVLVNELKRRGLWASPPSYLGIHDWTSWKASQHDDTARRQGALEELATECYVFVFVTRFGNLKRQLTSKDNIDGLVLLSIRNFLFERQKRFDPLGYRVFGLLRTAARKAISEGALFVLEGDSAIRNDTVLGVRPDATVSSPSSNDWETTARQWNDLLMPHIVTAWGRGQGKVVDDLCRLLTELKDVDAFKFKDLVDPLKRDLRTRWATIVGQEFGSLAWESSENLLTVDKHCQDPGADFIERQSFLSLVTGFRKTLAESSISAETKNLLSSLFELLTNYAAAELEEDHATWKSGTSNSEVSTQLPPSNRKIAAALGISRSRLSRLFVQLGELMKTTRSRQSALETVISIDEGVANGDNRGEQM